MIGSATADGIESGNRFGAAAICGQRASVGYVRKKVGGDRIETVRGAGYRMRAS